MARDPISVEQLEQLANAFKKIEMGVSNAVALMREKGMPSALVHYKTIANSRIPELLDWSVTLNNNVESQTVAFELGVVSQAQLEKTANERRKKKATPKRKGEM